MSKKNRIKSSGKTKKDIYQVRAKVLPLELEDRNVLTNFPLERVDGNNKNNPDKLEVSITGYDDGGLEFLWPGIDP